MNKKVKDEQNGPGNFFYQVVLKSILPTRSELFLFCTFLGALLGVGGWGGFQSGFKTCVPQVKT